MNNYCPGPKRAWIKVGISSCGKASDKGVIGFFGTCGRVSAERLQQAIRHAARHTNEPLIISHSHHIYQYISTHVCAGCFADMTASGNFTCENFLFHSPLTFWLLHLIWMHRAWNKKDQKERVNKSWVQREVRGLTRKEKAITQK